MAAYDPVLNFFSRAFYGLTEFLRGAFNRIIIVIVGVVTAYFSMILKLINIAENYLNEMITTATNAVGEATTIGGASFLGLANYFVPLDLIFEYSAVLLGLWLVSLVYRFVKSWIPTCS